MPSRPTDESTRVTVSLKKNSVRAVLGAGLCSLAILHLFQNTAQPIDIAINCLLIIYFSASCIWLRIARAKKLPQNFFFTITSIDAFLTATSSAYFFQSLTVSFIFFTLISFNTATVGGGKRALIDALSFIAGIVLAIALKDGTWTASSSPTVFFVCFATAIAYLWLYAYYIHRRFKKVNASNLKLYNDQLLHKLRTYKLSRYVPPTVWNAINQGREASLKTERKRVTIFFSDIQGFSALSEELEAETLTDLLNQYLTDMVKIASHHRGTIDKFMGDGIMVLFGDTNSDGLKSDCLRCIAMAVAMRKRMRELETHWFNKGVKKPLKIRMGINTGYCTVGSFGTSEYMDYTVLGTHVNLASRLESAADPGEILISHETWALIKDVVMCRDKGEINAKGFSHPIKVYQVVDFRKDLGKQQSYFEERFEGFSMHLDLEKIRNFDKDKIVEHLELTAEKLKDKLIN